MSALRRSIQVITTPTLALGLALSFGCGSIAGNPKKPTDPVPPPSVVYALPLLDFALPDEVTATEAEVSGLNLLAPVMPGEGHGILRNWGKRFARIVARVNSLSERVNGLLDEDSEAGEGGEAIHFGKKAQANGLSGKVQKLDAASQASSGFAFEAVVCVQGKPTTLLRWTEAAGRVELTRDFKPKASGDDDTETFSWVAQATFAKTNASTTMTLAGEGSWEADDGDETSKDGSGMVERAVAERLVDGELRVKSVSDRYQEVPADGDYDGDSYLVGRLVPLAAEADDATTVKQRFGTQFAAYYKNFGGKKGPCQGGFDETASDLWSPDLSTEGPRWCLGRPLAAKRFLTEAALHRTLEALEPIGIVPKTELLPVAMPEGLSCD